MDDRLKNKKAQQINSDINEGSEEWYRVALRRYAIR